MHVAHLKQSVNTGRHFGTIEAGTHLWHDQNAFELAVLAERGTVLLEKFPLPAKLPWIIAKNILIVRSGAWGDLLLLSPALWELQMQRPECKITVACAAQHHVLFDNTPFLVLNYPLTPAQLEPFDCVLDLGDVLETNTTLHATDAFAKSLRLESISDYAPRYAVSFKDHEWAKATYPRSTRKRRVGIQMVSSSRHKNYPMAAWLRVISILNSRGWEVMLLGSKYDMPPLKTHGQAVHCCYAEDYTFGQSAAILSTCDAFAGVDSVFVHLCHALDIPAIALYAAFPWQLYTGKAPKTRALTGVGDCAPCFWRQKGGRPFPPNQPCSRTGHCTVLADIKAETIASKIDALFP